MGVLATRSPHRPVPIGLSTAQASVISTAFWGWPTWWQWVLGADWLQVHAMLDGQAHKAAKVAPNLLAGGVAE
jgi:hypothetical protein